MKVRITLLACLALLLSALLTLHLADVGCRYRWVPVEGLPGWSVEQRHVDNPLWCRQ